MGILFNPICDCLCKPSMLSHLTVLQRKVKFISLPLQCRCQSFTMLGLSDQTRDITYVLDKERTSNLDIDPLLTLNFFSSSHEQCDQICKRGLIHASKFVTLKGHNFISK